ncbi:MAG: CBS domain-containing protein [Actinomycetota bacterium]|nr:CBS domain-containing protein [Actinomycetota bacterium]
MQTTVARVLADKGSDVISVAPDQTVYTALEVMEEHNIGAVVVLDGEDLIGILTERDYARKVILLDRLSKNTKVSSIMTTELHTVAPETTVVDCMGIMTDMKVRHLPVIEGGVLVGVISIGDVVKAIIAQQRSLIDQLEQYITS